MDGGWRLSTTMRAATAAAGGEGLFLFMVSCVVGGRSARRQESESYYSFQYDCFEEEINFPKTPYFS
jgi:hypothetical protein